MRIRKKHFAVAMLVFIVMWFMLFIGSMRGAELTGAHRVVNLTLPPISYAAWQKTYGESWWRAAQPVPVQSLPQIGVLRSRYVYLDGLPVREDLALALQTGTFRGLYRLATYRFYLDGAVWRPLLAERGFGGQGGMLFAGIEVRF